MKTVQTKGTKEWSDVSYNMFWGCSHDCVYCYARNMDRRFNRSIDGCVMKQVQPNIPKNKLVMFPSAHDVHPDYIRDIVMKIIELLNNNNRVLFTTKCPNRVFRELLKVLGEEVARVSAFNENLKQYIETKLEFRVTITTRDNPFIMKYEKNTGLYEERLQNVKDSLNAGYITSVSIEPLLCDYEQLEILISDIADCKGIKTVWLGCLSVIPPELKEHVKTIYTPGNLSLIHCRYTFYSQIRFKDTFLNRMKKSKVETNEMNLEGYIE